MGCARRLRPRPGSRLFFFSEPSKIVELMAVRAVSAGRWPHFPALVTDSAQSVAGTDRWVPGSAWRGSSKPRTRRGALSRAHQGASLPGHQAGAGPAGQHYHLLAAVLRIRSVSRLSRLASVPRDHQPTLPASCTSARGGLPLLFGCHLCHRDGRHLRQADGLAREMTAKLLGERTALSIWPAERRGTGVLQVNDG